MTFVFPHNYTSPLQRCVIRVEDTWYDCTAWRHSHPGGAEIVDQFHGKDATDAFYSLHSKEAIDKLLRMKGKPVDLAVEKPRCSVSQNFDALKKKLAEEGWYDRNWAIDFLCYVIPLLALCIGGTYLSYSYPLLATLMIGVGMQQAGWCGHDYVHGRGAGSLVLGIALGGFINGFSSRWWSQKHNAHHTFPNRQEFDSDIHNEPVLHLWFPEADKDVWFRKYQHLYYPFIYSFLYVSWRLQSLQFVLGSRNWMERAILVCNYVWIACLPWKVAVGSILLGGLLVAFVVTSNHQTEEVLKPDAPYNFIVDQFSTTRGIHCSNVITEYLFGGMQYQLEHHLFPTMPKAYYRQLRPIVKKFAEENGLQHHISGVAEILKLNYEVMRRNAQAVPIKVQ